MSNAFRNDGSFLEQFLAGKKDDGGAGMGGYVQDPSQYQMPGYNPYGAAVQPGMMPYGQYPYPYAMPAMGFRPNQAKNDTPPSRSLWVGSLSPDTTESDLRREFSIFGMIESIKMLLHKNCCFINFADIDSSIQAHEGSYGKVINGKVVSVGFGKSPDSSNRDDSRNPANQYAPCKNLWIGNLSEQVSEDDIRREFEHFGRIEKIRLLSHKNCAFVNFSTVGEAVSARSSLQGKNMYDRQIRINFGRDEQKEIQRKEAAVQAPPFAYPPQDPVLRDKISQAIGMILRRNLTPEIFEAFIQIKKHPVPFMQEGGEGYEYYKWKMYCVRFNHPEDQPIHHPPPPSHHSSGHHGHGHHGMHHSHHSHHSSSSSSSGGGHGPPPSFPALPPGDRQELMRIIEALEGTRESIKSSSSWISAHQDYIHDINNILKSYVTSEPSYDRRLHIFYVVNDVISNYVHYRNEVRNVDPVSAALLDGLVPILRSVYLNESEDRQKRVLQVLDMWKQKQYYDLDTVNRLEQQMKSHGGAAPPPPEDDDIPPWLKDDGPPPFAPRPNFHNPNPGWAAQQMPPPPPDPQLMESVNEYYSEARGVKRPPEDSYYDNDSKRRRFD